MNTEKLKQQLADLKLLKKNLKNMHKVFETNLKLASKIGEVHGQFPTNQVLMRNAKFNQMLVHIEDCIKSVRATLHEIKMRRK